MKKTMLLLLLACSLYTTGNAQPKIQKGTEIEVPDAVGYDKVLLLKNGKTAYMHYSGDGSLDVKMYDKDHKVCGGSSIQGKNWDATAMKTTQIDGTYEINGEVVVFLQQQDKSHTLLHRIRINAEDGKLLKEEQVADTKHSNFLGIANPLAQFLVIKDRASDCYAVLYYDNLDEDNDDEMKVMHFNGKHTLLGSARITSPDQKTRHVAFLDAVVAGEKSVFVCNYYSGSFKEDSKIFIGRLNAGESKFTSKALDFTDDFHKSNVELTYDKSNNHVIALINTYTKTKMFSNKSLYLSYLAYVSPDNLDVTGVKELSNEKINDYARNNLAMEAEFSGLPEGMFLNNKKETVILKQEKTLIVTTTKSGASYISGTVLGNIGISKVDGDGKELQAYMMCHSAYVGGEVPMMYLKDIDKGTWANLRSARIHRISGQGQGFRYISGAKNEYVVLSEYSKRIEAANDDNVRKHDKKESKINTAIYTIRNGNMTKAYLFGKPTGKKNKNTCFIAAADINEAGTMATIMVTKEGKHETAKMVWIDFE